MNINYKSFFVVFLLFCFNFTFASDFKLAFLNLDKLFSKSQTAIVLSKAILSQFQSEADNLKTLSSTLKGLNTQITGLKNTKEQTHKTKTDLIALEKQMNDDQVSFTQQYQDFRHKVSIAQNYATNVVLNKVNPILESISVADDYDLVLTSRQIVYAKPKYDITDAVITKLDNNLDTKSLIKDFTNSVNKLIAQSNENPNEFTPQNITNQ